MEIKEFLAFTATEFQEEKNSLQLSTRFRDLSSWSSLNALIFISSIHEEWGVLLSSRDLSKAKTLGDLFTLIRNSR